MQFAQGDRVRVIQAENPYTGCRGTIVDASGSASDGQLPLGYYVAIDGENGLARPFLVAALERIAAVSSRRPEGTGSRVGAQRPGHPSSQ